MVVTAKDPSLSTHSAADNDDVHFVRKFELDLQKSSSYVEEIIGVATIDYSFEVGIL